MGHPDLGHAQDRRGDGTMKSRLTAREKSKLRTLAESLVEKEKISSICAYGSKVAGYAREDSDYDMIIVAKDFVESIKYVQNQEPIKSSALIVDETALREDAKQSSLEELVVGRLLNIYEPIVNPEFLRSVEVEYKKRVIAEELIEIQSDYGDFSSNLIIPYEYFLFDKLHKRALVYPHTIYSYDHIYTCAQSKENKEFAVRGFREAAAFLASQGIVESTNESVSVNRSTPSASLLSKIVSMFSPKSTGVTQYAIQGSGEGIGSEIVKTEALSKVGRMGETVEPLVELNRPKRLLCLEEGLLFDDANRITEELAQMSGFGETYSHKVEKKGEIYTSTELLEISRHGKHMYYILKHFPDLKSIKWGLLNLWAFTAKKFEMSPLSRLQREYEAVKRVRKLGIRTHDIIGINFRERILVTAYVKGVSLSKFVEEITNGKSTRAKYIEKYGQILGKMHKAGLVYGDTKAENAIVCKGEIYLFDLEQAVENGDTAWDIAEFLYYAAKDAVKEEGMKLVAEAFLTGYRSENDSQAIEKAKGVRYQVPFQPFVSANMRGVVKDALERYSSAGNADL